MLQEFRCSKCNKLLGKIEGKAEIVCTRCKVLNAFNVPDQLREEIETKPYSDQWKVIARDMMKAIDDAVNCSECNQLQNDGARYRCMVYDNAIVPNKEAKHCENSIR